MEIVGLSNLIGPKASPKGLPEGEAKGPGFEIVGLPKPMQEKDSSGGFADWLVGVGLGASDTLLGAASWLPGKVLGIAEMAGASSSSDNFEPQYERYRKEAEARNQMLPPGAPALPIVDKAKYLADRKAERIAGIRASGEETEQWLHELVGKPLSIYREKMPGSTASREGVTGLLEKALTPITWLGEKADELGSKADPRLGYLSGFATELASFYAIGHGFKKANAFRKEVKALREKAAQGKLRDQDLAAYHSDVQRILGELKGKAKDEAPFKRLEKEYEALRQADPTALKEFDFEEYISKDRTDYETIRQAEARRDLPSAVNDPSRLEKAQAETVRKNTESQQHAQQVQDLRRMLSQNAPKTAKELVSPEVSTQPLPEPMPLESPKLTSPEVKTLQPLPDPMPVAPEPVTPPVKPSMGKSKWTPITKVDPQQLAVAELKAIAPEVYAAMKGKSGLTPEELSQVRDRLYDIASDFSPENAAHAEAVIGPAEAMMVEINKILNKGRKAGDSQNVEGLRSNVEGGKGPGRSVQEGTVGKEAERGVGAAKQGVEEIGQAAKSPGGEINRQQAELSIRDKHDRFRALTSMVSTSGASSPIPVLHEFRNLFTPEEIGKLTQFFDQGKEVKKGPGLQNKTAAEIAKEVGISDLVDFNKQEVGAPKEKIVPGTENMSPAHRTPAPQPKKALTPVERMRQRMRELGAEVDAEMAAKNAAKAEREKVVRQKMAKEKRIQKDIEDFQRQTRTDREFMEKDYSPENLAEDLYDVYLDEGSPFSHKNKPGGLGNVGSYDPFWYLTIAKELLHKAKRLQYALERGRMSMGELLAKVDLPEMPPTVRDGIVKVHDYLAPKIQRLKTYEKVRESKDTSGMFKGLSDRDWAKGPNPRKLRDGGQVVQPGLTVGEFKEIAADARAAKLKSPMLRMFETSLYSFEDAGRSANNWFKQNLYRFYQDQVARAKHRKEGESQWIDEMRKTFSKADTKMLYDYMLSRQEKGAELLKASGRTAPTLAEIQAKGLDLLMEKLDERFERIFNEVNAERVKFGKNPMKKVENYMTFARAFTMLEKLGVVENTVLASNARLQNIYAQMGSSPFPFAKTRTREIFPIKGDALDVYQSYFNNSMDHVHTSPVVAKAKRVRETFRDSEGQTWSLAKENPNLDGMIRNWSNHIAGTTKAFDPQWRGLYYLGNKLASNMVVATLGYSMRAVIQLGSIANVYSQTGLANTLHGIKEALNPESWHKAIEESSALTNRNAKGGVENLWGDLALKGRNAFRSPKEFLEAFEKAGMSPMTALDMFAAEVAWHSHKKQARQLGLTETKAIHDYANDGVVRTQGSSLPGDISAFQRNPVGKLLSTFQTFVINDFNYIMREVLGFKGGLTARNVGKTLRYIAGVTFMNVLFEDVLGMDSPYPTPVRTAMESYQDGDTAGEIAQEIANELSDVVPLIGSARYGGGLGGATIENMNKGIQMLMGKEARNPKTSQGLFNLLSTGGKFVGLPGSVQAAKSIRASQRGGTPAEVLTGKYLPAKRPAANSEFDFGGGFQDFQQGF